MLSEKEVEVIKQTWETTKPSYNYPLDVEETFETALTLFAEVRRKTERLGSAQALLRRNPWREIFGRLIGDGCPPGYRRGPYYCSPLAGENKCSSCWETWWALVQKKNKKEQ